MTKIALYKPDIAGNVGNIIRSCACFDIELIIIEPCGFPFDISRVKKSAMDYLQHIKLTRYNGFEEFYNSEISLKKSRLILATTKTDNDYKEFSFNDSDIILFGRESSGVPDEVANICDDKITIKMKNNMRSLNVAISCGIIASFLN